MEKSTDEPMFNGSGEISVSRSKKVYNGKKVYTEELASVTVSDEGGVRTPLPSLMKVVSGGSVSRGTLRFVHYGDSIYCNK
jgi:hypothetical protein